MFAIDEESPMRMSCSRETNPINYVQADQSKVSQSELCAEGINVVIT